MRARGFSLVELLLVLGAIALIAIAAFFVYPSVRANARGNAGLREVQTFAANASALFSQNGVTNFGTLSQQTMIRAHLFPDAMVQNGSQLISGVGSAVQAQTNWGSGGKTYGVTWMYLNVDSQTCVALATKLMNAGVADFVVMLANENSRKLLCVGPASGNMTPWTRADMIDHLTRGCADQAGGELQLDLVNAAWPGQPLRYCQNNAI